MKKTSDKGLSVRDGLFLEHVRKAIAANKKINPQQLGIHATYGGLITYLKYALKMEGGAVIDALKEQVEAGRLFSRPVKGGYRYYLPADWKQMSEKSGISKLLAAME